MSKVTERLDRVIVLLERAVELLELQTIVPEDAEPAPCLHPMEFTVDEGTMGQKPGFRMRCKLCGEEFRRA